MKGLKYDQDKPRTDLLDMDIVEGIAKVLAFGAGKYAENSWQEVENGRERYAGALLRHYIALRKGELIDTDSGLPHIYHIACNTMFINWFDNEANK